MGYCTTGIQCLPVRHGRGFQTGTHTAFQWTFLFAIRTHSRVNRPAEEQQFTHTCFSLDIGGWRRGILGLAAGNMVVSALRCKGGGKRRCRGALSHVFWAAPNQHAQWHLRVQTRLSAAARASTVEFWSRPWQR